MCILLIYIYTLLHQPPLSNISESLLTLANAEATKTIAEANKIAGVDTEGAKLDNEWKKVENRIQLSRENIVAIS